MFIRSTRCSTEPACHVRVRLADGGAVILRPLRGGEIDVLDTVFEGLSARSRQQRFLVPMPRLSGSARKVLSDVDGRDHVAWVAMLRGEPVGICRYVRTGPDTAEVAFEVIDSQQGRGIGAALVDAVTTIAHANGISRLEATVEPGNRASTVLLNRLGMRFSLDDGLLEGRGQLTLPTPRVDRQAVLAVAGAA